MTYGHGGYRWSVSPAHGEFYHRCFSKGVKHHAPKRGVSSPPLCSSPPFSPFQFGFWSHMPLRPFSTHWPSRGTLSILSLLDLSVAFIIGDHHVLPETLHFFWLLGHQTPYHSCLPPHPLFVRLLWPFHVGGSLSSVQGALLSSPYVPP